MVWCGSMCECRTRRERERECADAVHMRASATNLAQAIAIDTYHSRSDQFLFLHPLKSIATLHPRRTLGVQALKMHAVSTRNRYFLRSVCILFPRPSNPSSTYL